MVSKRLILLAAGSGLVAFSIIDMYEAYTSMIPFPYGFFDSAFTTFLAGLGTSILLYALIGRERLKWFALAAGLLYIISCAVFWSPFGPRGLSGLIAIPMLWLMFTAPFCLALTMKKTWKILAVMPLIFLLFSGYWFAYQLHVFEEGNPYDTPSRDELYRAKGYSFCGEFQVDPTPGRHVVSWNKTLRGNESIACYFKIVASRGEKYFLATHTAEAEISRKIPGELWVSAFYHSFQTLYDMEGAKKAWKAFESYDGGNTIEVHYILGDPKFLIPFYRMDVLISYRPVSYPEEYGLKAYTEVWWRVEINILG